MRGRKPKVIPFKPKPDKKSRPAPEWLSVYARQEWRRVVPVLQERRVLTEADYGGLEAYCVAYGRFRQLADEIDALPSMFVNSEKGAPRPHPAYRLQGEAMTLARQFAAELGLSPVSRSRAGVTLKADNDDGWSDMDL